MVPIEQHRSPAALTRGPSLISMASARCDRCVIAPKGPRGATFGCDLAAGAGELIRDVGEVFNCLLGAGPGALGCLPRLLRGK